ncbi:hypothetical protein CGK22_23900 [Vibrio parahaemolyticus]|nr:hypothetical protein CGK22_23900 [Vibrio parahaemolyticus]TOK41744.1 hypothetical protein CGI18_22865 [Vibrio parahaemolyticus]
MEIELYKDYLEYLHQDKPDALWHYTSFDAINNIVKGSGKLSFWVSEINFLNDHQEYFHGFRVLKDVFTRFKVENQGNPLILQRLGSLEPFFQFTEAIGTNLSFAQDAGVFVLSLTSQKDLLSQWRAYTPNGHGVSIGISPNFESELNTKSLLYPVIYDDEFKYEYAIGLLTDYINKPISPNGDNQSAISDFISKAKVACTLMKDAGFKEECEWRYVVYGQEHVNIHLRSSDYFLIPYVRLNVNSSCVMELIIGPNPHSDLAKKSLELLLAKSNLSAVQVTKTPIPYRGN